MRFSKAAILGVGLLGASFSLALKKKDLCRHVTGFGRSRETLERAMGKGIIDSFAADPADACRDADIIVLAAPVGSFIELVKKAVPSFKRGAIVTDVGSVKGNLVYELEALMPEDVHFIGGHPIAGSDRSGMDFADAELFQGALCIVTPTPGSHGPSLTKVTELWHGIGSKVMIMEPDRHDRVYAAVSHLPHLIAYTMVNTVSDIDESYFPFCGQGFRDMTRIAASSPEIWTDISLLNRENILKMISVFRENLTTIETHLKASEAAALKQEFARASSARERIEQN